MELERIDEKTIFIINELLPQLSKKAENITKERLKRILSQQGIFVATAFIGDLFFGMASIHFRETFMRTVGVIEDVVVDEFYNGMGFGQKLNKMLIEKAKKRGVEYIELTSKPKRKAAIALYKKLGFKLIAKATGKDGTNLYRLYL